jgi:hypothetical protein
MFRVKNISNTVIAHSLLSEIINNIDGRSVDDTIDKYSFLLVFAEDENKLINNG